MAQIQIQQYPQLLKLIELCRRIDSQEFSEQTKALYLKHCLQTVLKMNFSLLICMSSDSLHEASLQTICIQSASIWVKNGDSLHQHLFN